MRLTVQGQSGRPFEASAADVRPAAVLLDFNHPLAGETLYFWVKISALRRATDEEIAHSHPHSAEHRHQA
jgi:FKBP-type peptidyl-prolyl cis-trans isomerase SlyD